MSEKNCKQVLQYMGDIIDNRSDKDVNAMFFEHISKCTACNSKYEIALKLKELLAETQQNTDENFTTSVMNRVDKITPYDIKKSKPFYTKVRATIMSVAAAFVIVTISAVVVISFNNKNVIKDNQIQTSQKDEVQFEQVPQEQSAAFINDNFLKSLDDSNENLATEFSEQGILDILKNLMFGYVTGEYRYVAFVTVSDIEIVNSSAVIEYIPNSERNGVYLYSTSVSSVDLMQLLKGKLKQECVIDSNKAATNALILVRVIK